MIEELYKKVIKEFLEELQLIPLNLKERLISFVNIYTTYNNKLPSARFCFLNFVCNDRLSQNTQNYYKNKDEEIKLAKNIGRFVPLERLKEYNSGRESYLKFNKELIELRKNEATNNDDCSIRTE